jgi:hypothetical protein
MATISDDEPIESSLIADIAGYIPASTVLTREQRQEARYKLRASLRQVTSLKRLQSCGLPLGGDMIVRQKNGVYHYTGMSTCGSGWICPVCSAKIRYHRANEASRAVVSALDQGMSALFVTRTIPHSAEDRLGITLSQIARGNEYKTAYGAGVNSLRFKTRPRWFAHAI